MGNGFYYINPSHVMNGRTCKVGVGKGRKVIGRGCCACARLQRWVAGISSVRGRKSDMFRLFGTVSWSQSGTAVRRP